MKIEAKKVRVLAEGKALLDDVDLMVRRGELLGLIGPNGAGKTTLLKVLANLRAPARGHVFYDGLEAHALGRAELARTLAYLAQSAPVHWPLTVERLVALGRSPYRQFKGAPASRDSMAVERAMKATGVDGFRGRTATTLSGGERMRVLLARALAVEPYALLADEPVAALDPYHQLKVMELLREQTENGRTVVVVVHDLNLAARFCHRLALLHNGRLVTDGIPEDVLTEATLREVYRVSALQGRVEGMPLLYPWACVDGPTAVGPADWRIFPPRTRRAGTLDPRRSTATI